MNRILMLLLAIGLLTSCVTNTSKGIESNYYLELLEEAETLYLTNEDKRLAFRHFYLVASSNSMNELYDRALINSKESEKLSAEGDWDFLKFIALAKCQLTEAALWGHYESQLLLGSIEPPNGWTIVVANSGNSDYKGYMDSIKNDSGFPRYPILQAEKSVHLIEYLTATRNWGLPVDQSAHLWFCPGDADGWEANSDWVIENGMTSPEFLENAKKLYIETYY